MAKSDAAGKISETGKLLFQYHQAYRTQQNRDVPQKEFAAYIGIDDKYYNHIYKGRQRPSKEIVRMLAEFFDDLRFYDAGGYPRGGTIHRHYKPFSTAATQEKAQRQIPRQLTGDFPYCFILRSVASWGTWS